MKLETSFTVKIQCHGMIQKMLRQGMDGKSGVIARFVFLVFGPWWPDWIEIWSVRSGQVNIYPVTTKRGMLTDDHDK
jgi:hypothetical protein